MGRLPDEIPRNHGLIPGRGEGFISSPKRPDHLWGPSNVLEID
jgi:hypothetical protein